MFFAAVVIALLLTLLARIRRSRQPSGRRHFDYDPTYTRSASDDRRYSNDNTSPLGQATYSSMLDYAVPDTSWNSDINTDNCNIMSDSSASCDSSSSDSCCDSSSSSD